MFLGLRLCLRAWVALGLAVLIAQEQCQQAVVIRTARRASLEMSAHAWHEGVSGCAGAGELKIDVPVERVEALLAVEFRSGRADKARYQLIRPGDVIFLHVRSPALPPRCLSALNPRAASTALSFCRASWIVL